VALGPQVFRTNQILAQLLRDRARWLAAGGRAHARELGAALVQLQRLKELRPESPDVVGLEGELLLLQAEDRHDPRLAARAAERLEASLKARPDQQKELGPRLEAARRLAGS
jgi:hypothetical protein